MSFIFYRSEKNKAANSKSSDSTGAHNQKNLVNGSEESIVNLHRFDRNQESQVSQPSSNVSFDFSTIHIQPKLRISQSDDIYEKEADEIAGQIVASDTDSAYYPSVTAVGRRNLLEQSPSSDMDDGNQHEGLSDHTANRVKSTLNSGGQPLDSSTRLLMESRFGYDFSQIRIHTGSDATASAESLGALAYTTGQDIVFREGMYSPRTDAGQRLIAHELVHVIQQEKAGTREAVTTAAGNSSLLQRQEAKEENQGKKKEDNNAGEVIAEGLKTVAEQAVDNNPKVKKEIIEPLEKAGKKKAESMSTGEKAAVVSFGVATVGLSGGVLLSDPKGRKLLEGINLGAPLAFIPYMPLTGFSYKLPSGDMGEKSQFRFETTFSGNDYLRLLTERKNFPKMSLGVKMQWGYDPNTEQLRVLGAQAQLGLMPGVSIAGGTYSNILSMPQTFLTPEGGMVTSKKRIPDVGGESIPDTRVMLSIDLLKLDKRIIGKRLYNILHSF